MARRQHEVVGGEVEGAHRGGEQRQIVAVPLHHAGQPLQERRDDGHPLDHGRDAAGHVEEREEIGVGEELAEHFETALAAAHAREPVVHQHHLRVAVRVLPALILTRPEAMEGLRAIEAVVAGVATSA